ncbi:MAG: putative glycosyltransferase EpsJ [Candidatus Accumulibacter regalis]|jgi:GT2 family glycosyltransferase|uniref:Glycosyltransferase EpsJ n=1 Tax=Accumulibacter regalis TaxID=522306 RepID=A0A011P0P8_ACCRE|nr:MULTISPECIES: glycosyltransferase family 2 protein [unclassified Candidatus Accumulibacter]EXI88528.1 MAG: putative glycosyltransferase EpsJ [Candidatus Accumulibacter regalis]MQM32901.1 glycosyltransferase family 2 protein [Candidatus Accumulibacter phosphatis]MBL8369182.1 glycosyltransferase family 2 protein [Accumulibacter sp.]MBN8514934.1 glycosyltransferase family 2 protein [Accumulibacter sp.]MBO3703876.1 glycosyltransferase family 2 protein [Accumulibacter sp.]
MSSVSVVIPTYNCSRYISETLNSILRQGAADLEIIVIDDGSTDDTCAIARRFGDPVRVIEQSNAGVCAARNHGIREAHGEFIALVDHDDYWQPNKLANQLAAFADNPQVDVVFTDFVWWRQDDAGAFPAPADYLPRAAAQGVDDDFSGWIYHQMLLDSWVLTSTALARTAVVVAQAGFDEALPYSEDWDFWLRVSRSSQFLKLREATTLYRQHSAQGSRVIRPIDYRTRLLETAAERWGLCSQDGRCVAAERFRRQLAIYCAEFGLGHLKGGVGASRAIAARAFLKAWSIDRSYWRSLAYLAVTPFGWKPGW